MSVVAPACAHLWVDDYQYFAQGVADTLAARPAAAVAESLPLVYAIAVQAGGLAYQCAINILRELALAGPARRASLFARYTR